MTAAKVELGRFLFYDRRMSVNGRQSCGSCHRQELAFTDGRAQAQGATGELHPRSAMSLVNVAYNAAFTWANTKLASLEQQMLTPMLGENPVELGLKGREPQFLDAVRRDPVYQPLFPKAFPGESDPVTLANVVKAIACFERGIVSMRSPYDLFRFGHDENAISESAKRGDILFNSSERARCFRCHGGWNFNGNVRYEGGEGETVHASFFNTGVAAYASPNRGLFEQTGREQDFGKFRVPTLRNIAVTAPYMHDGSLATLEDVIGHYASGGRDDPHKSDLIRKLNLSEQDRRDLIEFLKSLTDQPLLHDPRWSDPWPR